MKYCSQCGSRLTYRIPDGDDRSRFICDSCRTVHYENPKMVVGCIPETGERLLFCRRSIMPQYGKWTIPAGFLEKGETVEAGAKRETLPLYNLTFISQVYLIFRAHLVDSNFHPGDESLEVRLFKEEEVPWDNLAFPVIRETLKAYFRDRSRGFFPFHIGDISPDSYGSLKASVE